MFQNSDEVILRELKLYVEDWEKLNIKNKIQFFHTMFLSRYVSSGCNLFGICYKPDGLLSDHETFCIYDDQFDIIKSTCQDKNIMWKFISKGLNEDDFPTEATDICNDKI